MTARDSLRLLLPALVLSACAAPGSEPAVVTDQAQPEGEQLIGQPPAGWKRIAGTNLGHIRRAEYIPAEESEATWSRRITFESFADEPLPDPVAFVELLTEGRNRECGTFERFPTFSGEENGYPTAVHLLVCHQDRTSGQSEITLMKTIRGNDAFYVISRGRRGPPIAAGSAPDTPAEEVGAWALYLRSIRLCDTSRPEHPCPATGGSAGGGSEPP